MANDDARMAGNREMEFEASLRDVVLRAFAAGVDIERTWEIESPVAEAPCWRIGISRFETDKETRYDPTLIEE